MEVFTWFHRSRSCFTVCVAAVGKHLSTPLLPPRRSSDKGGRRGFATQRRLFFREQRKTKAAKPSYGASTPPGREKRLLSDARARRFKEAATDRRSPPPENRHGWREIQCCGGSAHRDGQVFACLAHLPVERAAANAPPRSTPGLPGDPARCAPVGVQALRRLVT